MQTKPFRERRKFIRFVVDARVNYRSKECAENNNADKSIPGLVRNLSVSGSCLILDAPFAVGAALSLEIILPSFSHAVHLEGIVIWSRPFMNQDVSSMFETGIKFTSIAKKDEPVFLNFLQKKMIKQTDRHSRLT